MSHRAISLCADLTTGDFVRQRVGERRVAQILQFFSGEHTDEDNGRQWNMDAKQLLLQFLTAATSEVEASLAADVVSVCQWTGAAPRWNPEHVRRLHAAAPANLAP